MDAGRSTVEWLYQEQLQVDEDWSVRRSDGFTWWPYRHAQHVDVIGSEVGPDGNPGYFVRVKTDFVRDVDLSDSTLAGVELLMSTATMSGLIYDPETRLLSLSSLVTVHKGNRPWMSRLISVAAMLQAGDAHFIAASISGVLGGQSAESGHPENGVRPEPDALAKDFTPAMAAAGKEPSRWTEREFQDAVEQYMQRPPALLATGGGQGLTVELPYGQRSSLCEMQGDQAHPRIGNGLLLLQSFPVSSITETEGTRLALELNDEALNQTPAGYGFGSYCFRDDCVRFTGFIPNAAYADGLLPNIYFSCIGRAHAMAERLSGTKQAIKKKAQKTADEPSYTASQIFAETSLFGFDEEVDVTKTTETPSAEECFRLGVEHDKKGDDEEAEGWYRVAAAQGHAKAQCALGRMYQASEEDDEAVWWYRLAADQGDAKAQCALGRMYQEREFLKDADEAVRWYRLAADQGDAMAQNSLGGMYQEGEGVPEDDDEAVRLYRLAADQGYAMAQTNLGYMYDTGRGVPKDDDEAVRWYRLAADEGDVDAQEKLVAMSRQGRVVLQDDEPAAAIVAYEEQLLSVSTIIDRVAKELGNLQVTIGRTRGFRGLFKEHVGSIWVKAANDLEVFSHEVGHHLYENLFKKEILRNDKSFEKELIEQGEARPNLVPENASTTRRVRVGAAEFFRIWSHDPRRAKVAAPEFYAEFERRISGDLERTLRDFQKAYIKHYEANPADRFAAHLNFYTGRADDFALHRDLYSGREPKPLESPSSKRRLTGGTRLAIAATLLYWAFLFFWTQDRELAFDLVSSFEGGPIRALLYYFWIGTFNHHDGNDWYVSYEFVLGWAVAVPLFFLGLFGLIRWTIRGFKSSGF